MAAEEEDREGRLLVELGEARGSDPRIPDFFIVGMPKGGTTALYAMLRGHSELFMPAMKEPHFLSRDPGEPRREQVPSTVESYLELFADAQPGQLKGEGSTSYLVSPVAPRRIAALNPQARIVAVLREPASFVRSMHLQLWESGLETEPDLAAALALEPQRRAAAEEGLWARLRLYSDHLRWSEQLRRYEEQFGAERVLTLIYDDFRADNEAVARRVARFLGIDEEVRLKIAEANPTVFRRDSPTARVVQGLSGERSRLARGARLAGGLLPRGVRRGAMRALRRNLAVREPPPPDERLAQELRKRFAPEVAAAGEHLGRDLLGLWGYEQAARKS